MVGYCAGYHLGCTVCVSIQLTRMRGSDGHSTFSLPSIPSGVLPFRRASMTHASSGEYAMRRGLRDSRARRSALRCEIMAE